MSCHTAQLTIWMNSHPPALCLFEIMKFSCILFWSFIRLWVKRSDSLRENCIFHWVGGGINAKTILLLFSFQNGPCDRNCRHGKSFILSVKNYPTRFSSKNRTTSIYFAICRKQMWSVYKHDIAFIIQQLMLEDSIENKISLRFSNRFFSLIYILLFFV